MKPGQIRREVKKTLDAYSGEIKVFSKKVKVGKKGLKGTAVGPIPGETPYIEVYAPNGGQVFRIDLYGTRINAEAKELLKGIRFDEPQRYIASLDLPTVNSREALYPRGGPEDDLIERPKADATNEEPATYTTQSTYTSSSVPRCREKRIYEGCWLANSRFWLQTQHDSKANSARGDGLPTGFSIVGRPNYWSQYTHGELEGYGRCKSDYYTNDKFAVDYPYNRGDRIYSPFKGGKVVFAGQVRSHRGLGIFVVIRAGNGKYVSSLGHLSGLRPRHKEGREGGQEHRNRLRGQQRLGQGSHGRGAQPPGVLPLPEVHAGAPYGGRGFQTLYYHYAGTAARDGGGIRKLSWSSTSYQKAEGDRISN
jgi:hypothetical protein